MRYVEHVAGRDVCAVIRCAVSAVYCLSASCPSNRKIRLPDILWALLWALVLVMPLQTAERFNISPFHDTDKRFDASNIHSPVHSSIRHFSYTPQVFRSEEEIHIALSCNSGRNHHRTETKITSSLFLAKPSPWDLHYSQEIISHCCVTRSGVQFH